MRIDAHHHLWQYRAEEFAWIGGDAAILRRDFLPLAFEAESDGAQVDGAIAVQARCSIEETRWLLECAAQSRKIARVVGWAPLASASLNALLDELAGDPHLAGFREIAQDQPSGFLLHPAFNEGVRQLTKRGLTYDILIRAGQIPEAIRFVDMHPQQRFVLDHAGKPEIAHRRLEPWRTHVKQLAERPHVLCKISGLVTEADWQRWTEKDLYPYLDICLEAFGPERCMAGSDWPVCLVASTYERWWQTLERWAASLQQAEQDRILGGTAASFYGCPAETSSVKVGQ